MSDASVERQEARPESVKDTLCIANKKLAEAELIAKKIIDGIRQPQEKQEIPRQDPHDLEGVCKSIESKADSLHAVLGLIQSILLG